MAKSITAAFSGGSRQQETEDHPIENVDSFDEFRSKVIDDLKGRKLAAFLRREETPSGLDYYVTYASFSKDKRKPSYICDQRFEDGFLEGPVDENMVRRSLYTALIGCKSIVFWGIFGTDIRKIPYDIFLLDGTSIVTNPIFPVDISKPEGLKEAIYNIKITGMEPLTPKTIK